MTTEQSSKRNSKNTLYTFRASVEDSAAYDERIKSIQSLPHMVSGNEVPYAGKSQPGQVSRAILRDGVLVAFKYGALLKRNPESESLSFVGEIGVHVIMPYQNGNSVPNPILSQLEKILNTQPEIIDLVPGKEVPLKS